MSAEALVREPSPTQRRLPSVPGWAGEVATVVAVLVIWQLVASYKLVGAGAFPSVSSILTQLWADRGLYSAHVLATVQTATLGLAVALAAATLTACLFSVVLSSEYLLHGPALVLYCIPLIVLSPLMAVTIPGTAGRVVLAAVAAFYPALVCIQVGLRSFQQPQLDVVRAFGGGALAALTVVRVPAALPGFIAGCKVAAPAAVLGAVLADLSGARYGLGTLILTSLRQANPARLWGIGLVATLIGATAYAAFAVIGVMLARRTDGGGSPIGLGTATAPRAKTGPRRIGAALAAVSIVLLGWQLVLTVLGVPELVGRGPVATAEFLFTGDSAGEHRGEILSAMSSTMVAVAVALFIGLTAALVAAMLLNLRPTLLRSVLPVALFVQCMPLIAVIPAIAVVLGRGTVAIVVIAAAFVFFPAFVIIAQGLSNTPSALSDVFDSYGASPLQRLTGLNLPVAVPFLFTAASLAAPQALLAVLVPEFLVTGTGLGHLLGASRGQLDFGMLWAVSATVALISVLLFVGIRAVGALVSSRIAPSEVQQ